uniref:Fibrinogen-like protein 1 n=1 Tax=Callithrix jacchus TaxID=9483 RepID=A0A5F4W7J7_CALJA
MANMFGFILVATALIMGKEVWALEDCAQEQARLRAQVRLLETRVKQQQVKITHLLQEKEVQLLDKGEESSVIHIGGKRQYADCSEVFNDGYKLSGFYKIKPLQSPAEFSVYCDMSDGGGWTVIQRRSDGSENFNRGWNDYENGFGNFVQKRGEYWLGNKNLHLLTTQEDYTLKIDLEDFEKNSRYAQYKNFKVGDEKNFYELNIGEYSGTAGDSLAGNFHPEVKWWASHQRMKFSTWDRDHDNYEGNCAEEDQGGWWFNRSHFVGVLVIRLKKHSMDIQNLVSSVVSRHPLQGLGTYPLQIRSTAAVILMVSLCKSEWVLLQRALHG